MTDDRVERALDVFVYGPLGLGLWLREAAPSMIDTVVARGRAEVDRRQEQAQQRITTARSMGQVALAFGLPQLRKRAEQQLQQVRSQADRVVENVVGRTSTNVNGSSETATPPPSRHAPTSDAPAVPGTGEPVVHAEPVARSERPAPATSASPAEPANSAARSAAAPGNGAGRASSGHLAIPGYDALSASQVVERLAGLGEDDLRAVREYELHNRNRRTILGKIDQLTTA